MLAEDTELQAQWIVSRHAVLACAITDSGIHHHSIANTHRRHAIPNTLDNTSAITAKDPPGCNAHAGDAAHDPQIEMIQRRGEHADAHFTRRRDLRRLNVVAKLDLVERTVRIDRQRSHGLPRRLYSATTCP
jgi:hypothetical protein